MNNTKYILLLALIFTISPLFSQNNWDKVTEIEKNIIAPTFKDKTYNVLHFGAKNDGKFDSRSAINNAIVKCSENGGGRVVIPAGKYYIGGSILMKSNVNLHFSEGAEILFSSNSDDYLPMVLTRWEGTELYNFSPLIYAYNAVNIAVTGKGKLDGNGIANIATWKPSQKKDQQALREMGRTGVPVQERLFGKGHFLRPAFIEFFSCNNILIEDISLTNSPFWVIHPIYCNNVTVRGVYINSHTLNSDGCDPESSSNVLIENCHFITEDDGVAIKAGRDNDAWRVGRSTENVIIRNSTLQSATNGVCIGSEMSGGVRNVFVENVKIPKSQSGIYFKSNLDRGGFIENVFARNITMDSVETAIKFEPDYKSESKENYPTLFRNFVFENITCNFAKEFGADISGFEFKPVRDVSINNSSVKKAGVSVRIRNAENVEITNTKINGQAVSQYLPNKKISLNGTWDVAISDEKPAKFSSKVPVPGVITMAKPSLGDDLDGNNNDEISYKYVWYKHNFLLNETAYPSAVLHIRAKYNATVWVNGIEIGYDHYSTYSHAEFDISKALKTNGNNEIVVRIGSWNTSSAPSKENSSEWWRNSRAPGIWDDVWIDLGQNVAVNHVKILPDTKNKLISTEIELKNYAEATSELTVTASIFDEFDKISGNKTTIKIDLNTLNTASINIPADKLTYWSAGKEGNPKLYRLNVKVTDANGNLLADKNETFGYRSIETKGKDVLLNGQKVIFRAENIAFVRALTRWADFMFDEKDIRNFLRSAVQDYNFNYLRIHLGHGYSKLYEIADQEGIMLQDEWRYMHDDEPTGKDLEEAEIEFRRWIRQNVNHPSIVTWDQENEGNVRLENLKQELRKYDPTRLWGEDDFKALHIYQYSENIVKTPEFPILDDKPMTILESCRLWTNELGLLEPREDFKTSRTASGWGIYYFDEALIGQLLADLHADLGTNFRTSRIQAWAPFALLSGWVNGQSFFLGDMKKSLTPQANLLVLKKINEPVGVSIDMLQTREWYKDKVVYKPGSSTTKNINVWNDFAVAQNGKITVNLKKLSGEILNSYTADISVPAYESGKAKITFKIPSKKGIYLLEPIFTTTDGIEIEGVTRRIMVAPKVTKDIEEQMGFGGKRTRIPGGESVITNFLKQEIPFNLEKKIMEIVGEGLLDKLSYSKKDGVYNIQSTIYESPTRSEITRTAMDKSGKIISQRKSEALNYADLPENKKRAIVEVLGTVPIDESRITRSFVNDDTIYEISMFNSDVRHRLTFDKNEKLKDKEMTVRKR